MKGAVVEVSVGSPVNSSQLRTTAFEIGLNVVFTVTRQSFTAFFP